MYQLEKMLEDSKDKLRESDVTALLRSAIERVNQAKKTDDTAAINAAVDDMNKASQAMAEHLYSQQPASLVTTAR